MNLNYFLLIKILLLYWVKFSPSTNHQKIYKTPQTVGFCIAGKLLDKKKIILPRMNSMKIGSSLPVTWYCSQMFQCEPVTMRFVAYLLFPWLRCAIRVTIKNYWQSKQECTLSLNRAIHQTKLYSIGIEVGNTEANNYKQKLGCLVTQLQ